MLAAKGTRKGKGKGAAKKTPRKKKMQGRHICWQHFKLEWHDGKEVAVCNYCGVKRAKSNPTNLMSHAAVCPNREGTESSPTRELKQTLLFDSEEGEKAALLKASARVAACRGIPLRFFNDPEVWRWAQVVRATNCPLPNQAQVREAVIEEEEKAVVAAINE
ncbi:hypothetical protein KIPB_016118, partial [Kipferlia bialata]|eukprot:g16118.t1